MPDPPIVLIVDDSDEICQVLSLALGAAGIASRVATSRPEAEALALALGRDGLALVLLDVYLEDGAEGYALYETWQAAHPDLPIVLMSGAPEAALLPAVVAGGVSLIAKPFDLDRLLPLLVELLERDMDGPLCSPCADGAP